MAFPQRGTRTLEVDGRSFLWHMSPKNVDRGGALATLRATEGGPILHYWPADGFPSPSEAVEVLRFSLGQGWADRRAGSISWVGRAGDHFVLRDERVPAPWEQVSSS